MEFMDSYIIKCNNLSWEIKMKIWVHYLCQQGKLIIYTYYKYIDGKFVYLAEEKADELIGSNCKAGDIVFTHRGTIGQVGLIPYGKFERYVISQSGMKLTVDSSRMNNEFLFYFFKSKFGQYQLLKTESQVGVPSISNPLTSLKAIEIPVPKLMSKMK